MQNSYDLESSFIAWLRESSMQVMILAKRDKLWLIVVDLKSLGYRLGPWLEERLISRPVDISPAASVYHSPGTRDFVKAYRLSLTNQRPLQALYHLPSSFLSIYVCKNRDRIIWKLRPRQRQNFSLCYIRVFSYRFHTMENLILSGSAKIHCFRYLLHGLLHHQIEVHSEILYPMD